MSMAKPRSRPQLSMQAAYYADDLGGIADGHWCYRFYEHVFLAFDDAQFADLYQDKGRCPISPRLLICISLLQYLHRVPDRLAVEQSIGSRYWRIALGIQPGYAGFDPSVLCNFRKRLVAGNQQRLAFETVLGKLRELGLVKHQRQARVDGTFLLADIALLSRLDLLRETLRLVVCELWRVRPELHENLGFLRLHEQYSEEIWLGKAGGGDEQLQAVGRDGQALLALCGDSEVKGKDVLARVLAENFEFSESDEGPAPKPPAQLPPGHMVSPHEPDVEVGKKGDQLWNGDKVHLVETVPYAGQPGFLIDLLRTGPRVPDVNVLAELAQRLHLRLPTVDLLLADGGYAAAGHTKTLAALGLDLITPPRLGNSKGLFPASDFTYDFVQQVATCPAGQHSSSWYQTKTRLRLKFSKGQCAGCPLRASCTSSAHAPRTLTLSVDFEQLCADRQRAGEAGFAKLYKLRAGIEATVSELVRCCGLRRSRYRGGPKRELHMLLAGAALNVRRMLHCLLRAGGRNQPAAGTVALAA
jgi:transposase